MASQREQLQAIWDSDPATGSAEIYYRPRHGWVVVFDEVRHFGDTGDVLGATFADAKRYLLKVLKPHTTHT